MPVGQLGMLGISTGANLLTGIVNNALQRSQQEKLNVINAKYNKEMTDYNMEKQMEMWERTGYKPQVDQMKEAGLNPALMYKGSGAGGQTALSMSSQGAAQANPKSMGIEGIAQLALMKAQTDNINADTKLKETTATKTGGIDTRLTGLQGDKIQTEMGKIAQETQSEVVKTAILKIEETLKGIQETISTKTMNMSIAEIGYRTEQAYQTLEQQKVQTQITKQTEQAVIKMIREQSWGAALQNILTKAQTSLAGQNQKVGYEMELKIKRETANMVQSIEQDWFKLNYEERRTRVQEEMAKIAGRAVDIQEAEQMMRVIAPSMNQGMQPQMTPIQGLQKKY